MIDGAALPATAASPASTATGWSRIRRPSRGWKRTLLEAPGDWVFDRNRLPGWVLGWSLIAAGAAATFAGVPLGPLLAINWVISQTPSAVQFVRMVRINLHNGIHNPRRWDWSWWTRPQSHQLQDVATGPEPTLETEFDPATFVNPKPTWVSQHAPWMRDVPVVGDWLVRRHPAVVRRILKWETQLIARANQGDKRGSFVAGQVDDWLNQRARTPSFTVGIAQLVVGAIVGLPWLGNFLINAVVSDIPTALSGFLAWQTGDTFRFTRPGLHQRTAEVRRRQRGETREMVMQERAKEAMALSPTATEAVVVTATPLRSSLRGTATRSRRVGPARRRPPAAPRVAPARNPSPRAVPDREL